MLDVERIRKDFPILRTKMNGKPLIYLDSTATSQKPRQVINAISRFYRSYNANIHRGIYQIAEKATDEYIDSKTVLAKFIGAKGYREIVYVRNATEAINLAVLSWGDKNVVEGDRILISKMEHHSNIVPWQMLAKKKNAVLDYIELRDGKTIDMGDYAKKLEGRPKIVAFTHASNVLGTINDAQLMTKMAHEAGAMVLVDGAQSAPHMRVSMREIGCDFFALSGHKMLAPTGIGALYAKEELLEEMPPVYGGGDMIRSVGFQESTWNELPWKFESGTQNIEGGIGMKAAIRYLKKLGMDDIREHEKDLTGYALKRLCELDYVKVYGPGIKDIDHRLGVIAFGIDGVHSHDAAAIFDSEGIAIRSGHHCAMPLVREIINEAAVSRMSFYIYNTKQEIDIAVEAIGKARKMFARNASPV
ncbi:MAG: cysteine desulfurase [Candidatus Micrarchaeota archaeon]|nr:cysteine desulfurase [Candidatus Micrarchaeota archaeon]MDE1864949.1 cysteine desulfurase [Candidatus Micrarchaeota archaeon]